MGDEKLQFQVLIGEKENSISYECKIEEWHDKTVYINIPQRFDEIYATMFNLN